MATKQKPAPSKNADKEKESAKAAGLTLVKYRILKAMKEYGREVTYKDIEAKTGYYSNLTSQMRRGNDGSLAELGLVKERESDSGLVFSLTDKAKKLLVKGK